MRLSTPLITCYELYEKLRAPQLRLFDVRWYLDPTRKGRDTYLRGHIPGARFADLEADLSAPRTRCSGRHPWASVAQMRRFLEANGVSNDSAVVCYDDAGGAVAARLWMLLRWLGHDRVAVLEGGLPRWRTLGLPVTAQFTPPPSRGRFVPAPKPRLLVDLDEVRRISVGEQPGKLMDARAGERYRGEVEPVDPRAGHIPGALNRPFADNLGSDGLVKPAAALARGFRSGESVIHYCGSGVTACHNTLAMDAVGLRNWRLYPGSWSEWSRHENLPAARGEAA